MYITSSRDGLKGLEVTEESVGKTLQIIIFILRVLYYIIFIFISFKYFTNDPDRFYDSISENLLQKHSPLQSNFQKGNSVPFMAPEMKRVFTTVLHCKEVCLRLFFILL